MSEALIRKEAELAVAEKTFEEELATPAAEQERERSQAEYAQFDASEASGLLDEKFAPEIEQLNEDPARLLTDLGVEKMLGPDAARVSSPTGGREIVEGSMPLTGSIGGEGTEPVDLTLERSGDSYLPADPTVPTELPATAEGAIEVGEGIAVQMPATDDHEAVQVGQMSLFYPETETATDTMLAPVAGGVEILDQLRSAESPEQLGFPVEVPPGDDLAATPGGGAEIVDAQGTPLEEVPPPTAVDAQGAAVPTTMSVEGDTLVVDVGLAATQPAFPVLVDPSFLEEPTNFGAWEYANVGAEYGHNQTGSDLEVWSLGSKHPYGAGTHGAFTYTGPGETAWIEAATFRSISFFPNSCGGNQPHGYIELYNPGANRIEAGPNVYEGLTATGGVEWQTGWVAGPGTTEAIFGVGTKPGEGASNSCVHEFYLGNYSLEEKDTTPPVITSVTGVPLNRWFKPSEAGEAHVAVEDTGFGVFEVAVGSAGAVTSRERPGNCSGVYGSRCPHRYEFSVPPAYGPGKRNFSVNAQDAMGNPAGGVIGETWEDRYAPEIVLNGQFAEATEEVGRDREEIGGQSNAAENEADENKLSIPTYELEIHAIDGSNATPQEAQSGVQSVRILLDGKEQTIGWGTQTCPATESSCGIQGTYPLRLPGLATGVHKLDIIATDRVGHVREREIEFEYIPATGEGENQVLEHFTLPDGEGEPEEGEETGEPEVAVNVMNGDLLYHQQDAEVATTDAGLPIERFYNSALAQAQSSEFGTGWTLGDTPELEVGANGGGAGQATIVQGDGTLETAIPLPTQDGTQEFDATTQDAIEKTASGYTVTDEGEEAEPAADLTNTGTPSVLQGSAEATLDLEHEGGELSEIAVDDPGTASGRAEQADAESGQSYLQTESAGGGASEGGHLSAPVATATDGSGDVYVADSGHDRVQEFGPSGSFLRQWGGAGSGEGQFREIVGVATGPGSPEAAWSFDKGEGTGTVVHDATGDGNEGTLENGAARNYLGKVGGALQIEDPVLGPRQCMRVPAAADLGPGGGFTIEAWLKDEGDTGTAPVFFKEGAPGTGLSHGLGVGFTVQHGEVVGWYDGESVYSSPWAVISGNWIHLAYTYDGQRMRVFVDGMNGRETLVKSITPDELAGTGPLWIGCGWPGSPGSFEGKVDEVRVYDRALDEREIIGDEQTGITQAEEEGGGPPAEAGADVYVAEPSRVEEFSPTGAFIRQIGGAGTGNGRFTGLTAIATDPAGHLWALDDGGASGAYRAQEFSAAGTYMETIEFKAGSGAGQLTGPQGIAVDDQGDLWIADTGDNRVEEFSPTGTLIRSVGSAGTGNGQFTGPRGIAVEPTGDVLVADTGGDRVQWLSPAGVFVRKVGTPGDGNGQFSGPTGVAAGASSIWVADTRNDRVEKLTESGEYSLQAGGGASEGGHLSAPVATATDGSGDVYVADSGHDRVQEFGPSGSFLRQWGGAGSGEGQFREIVGVAAGSGGDVYVAEPGRVEEFTATGGFIRQIGTVGTGNGQFTDLAAISVDPAGDVWALDQGGVGSGQTADYRVQELSATGGYMKKIEIPRGTAEGLDLDEPRGLAIAEEGHIWVADTGNDRVLELAANGALIREIGVSGAAAGDFDGPRGLAADATGDVWVADTGNDRFQEFNRAGGLLARFGRVGGEPGQLSAPSGLAVEESGDLWVADTRNDRVEEWTPSEPTPSVPIAPEPAAAVDTSGGLVQGIEGKPTGTISYQHEGGLLTGVVTTATTTHYGYAPSGRLDRIELPDSTKAEAEYDSLGRVVKLKVSVEGGPPATTEFEYSSDPRETIVRRPSHPTTRYAIGGEGSVLKWWDAVKPPEIEEMGGSLWKQRTEVHPGTITPGDQSLEVAAHSFHGIASIQVVANGNQVVAEKDCEKTHVEECTTLEKIYETETEDWAPGILQLEVLVTDGDGERSSQRLEDDIPYTPPPADEEIEPPTFERVKDFREEFGLDLDLKGNERAIDERINDLIDAWHEPDTPEGEVARASTDRWGVPLRPADVAELEYRERYATEAAELIPAWAEAHGASSYAGYYIDQRQGGIIHVGFAAANQAALVGQLSSELSQLARGRIASFEATPTYSLRALYESGHEFLEGLPEGSVVSEALYGLEFDTQENRITIESANVGATNSYLAGLPSPERFIVTFSEDLAEPESGEPEDLREAQWSGLKPKRHRPAEDRLYGGDAISGVDTVEGQPESGMCTMGFGAKESTGVAKPNGEAVESKFALTAGHCFEGGTAVWRWATSKGRDVEFPVGTVARRAHSVNSGEKVETDAEAIELKSGYVPPQWIWIEPAVQLRVGAPKVPSTGEIACLSGTYTTPSCGVIVGMKLVKFKHGKFSTWDWHIKGISTHPGNSGGPVYSLDGNRALGIWDGGGRFFTPLLESVAHQQGKVVGRNVGVLGAPNMGHMQIVSR